MRPFSNVDLRTLENGRVVAKKRPPYVEPVKGANVEALDGATGVVGGVWCFEVPGDPRGKGRPRFSRRNGRVRTVTDPQTRSYESAVALIAARVMPREPLTSSLKVSIVARFARPKRERGAALGALDVDNIAKAILDGLKHHFDDRRVVALHVFKERVGEGEEPHTLVRIEET